MKEKIFFIRICWFIICIVSFLIFSNGLNSEVMPPPEKILGFKVGADYHLATYEQAIEYFKILAQSTDKMKLFDVGKTSMGKVMTYATISSSENIKKLDHYKEISKRLALVKGVTEEEVKKLIKEGKSIVYIDGGLHATECAPAQHLIQLAYDLVSSNSQKVKNILDNVIIILVFANPDGMDLLAEWYNKNLGTPYEVSPMPWLYHKYVGHDNNRDSFMVNQVETQHLTKIAHKEWFPNILYNHHQTAPFPARIWIPPNSEPTNPNVHPLVVRWQNLIGSAMGAAFDQEEKEGAISRIVFDTWYPGYVTQVVDSHNIISILTETALYRYATPYFYTIRDFPEEYQELTISAFYPSPWKGGWWRLKDAVDYCLTASIAVLDVAAKHKEELLFDKYKMGKDVIERFRKEPPVAWIIPADQRDPDAAALLIEKMMLLGVEVNRATSKFTADGVTYPEGSYVIKMDQPFALFVKNIFEIQKYPDLRKYPDLWQGIVDPVKFEGAPLRSYDVTGWTLPLQMGVKAVAVNSPFNVDLLPLKEAIYPEGEITGNPSYAYILSHEINNSFIAVNRVLKDGGDVLWAKGSFKSNGKEYPIGTMIIPSAKISKSKMEKIAKNLHLKTYGAKDTIKVDTIKLKPVRIALYKSWVANIDEGWTRWIFEQFEFPFKNIHDAEIRAGNLKDRYDVLIIPSQSPKAIVEGHRLGTIPPEYVGGIGDSGSENIKRFIEEGGALITINNACDFAIERIGIPVMNSLKDVKPEEFTCSGALLRIEFDNTHPVCYGMPKQASGFFSYSPAFTSLPTFEKKEAAKIIAKYPEENPLMSGYIHGEKALFNKGAIAEATLGNGKVILLGFGIQHRAQPHNTFKLLFNSIYYDPVSD
ncbi:MAG: M14 metallopeptidase family protein [Acidobacteriota bacterium]